MRPGRASHAVTAVAALVAALASVVVAAHFCGIVPGGLATPLFDRGDGLFHVFVVDTVLETGWFVRSPRLGMPFGSSLLDFPLVEATNFALVHLLGLFTRDPFVVMNLFLLLGFATTGASAAWVLARLGIRPALASVGGFVFALLPYHFYRFAHPFLAHYAIVPVYCALLLELGRADPAFARTTRGKLALALGLVFASGLGLYYAFFACVLVAAIALRASLRTRSGRPAGLALLVVLSLGAGVFLQILPNLLHFRHHGANPAVAHRAPSESEIYALKPVELLLPSQQHRIPALAQIAREYADHTPLTNENATASQGLFLSLGLVIGLFAFLFGRDDGDAERRDVGFLQTIALLYASVGGLASVIAHLALPGIRAVNRISVFVAFLSLLLLLRILQRGLERVERARPRLAHTLLFLVIVAIGTTAFVDQVPARSALPTVDTSARLRDRRFFATVEHALPPRARVLVLPHMRFPEGRSRGAVDAYVPMRAVLASERLRFSYGGMGGRASDLWVRSLVRAPAEEAARGAARAGFDAVLVFVDGYHDGASVVARLEQALGRPLARTRDLVAFRLPASFGAGAPMHVAHALHEGFLGWEDFGASGSGSWADRDATMLLVHPGAHPEPVTVSMTLGSPHDRLVSVEFAGRTVARHHIRALERVPLRFELDVPPGTSVLAFRTDRPAALPGNGDIRHITFGVSGVRVEPRGRSSVDVPESP